MQDKETTRRKSLLDFPTETVSRTYKRVEIEHDDFHFESLLKFKMTEYL